MRLTFRAIAARLGSLPLMRLKIASRLSFFRGLVAAALIPWLLGGCSTAGYYLQSARGHWDVLSRARPVDAWLADPATPPALKARLELTQRLRDFAINELHEPDNASYRRYADLGRNAVIWNVVAAPELSLKAKTWCFPLLGCIGYRGYYHEADAEALATELQRDERLETMVYGVPAYSTLGWLPGSFFADPLLNTFINLPEGELARMIFHELAHQVVYAKGDTEFNESFASTVEKMGGQRWLALHADAKIRQADALQSARRADFRELTLRYRGKLEALFNSPLSDADKRLQKQALMAAMRNEYAALKASRWDGYSGYDHWFAEANNASLAVLSAYNRLVPNFERLFEREGRDFERFYAEVRRLATLPFDERRRALP